VRVAGNSDGSHGIELDPTGSAVLSRARKFGADKESANKAWHHRLLAPLDNPA